MLRLLSFYRSTRAIVASSHRRSRWRGVASTHRRPRCFLVQHREEVGPAGIVALLREQRRDLATMMGLMVEGMSDRPP